MNDEIADRIIIKENCLNKSRIGWKHNYNNIITIEKISNVIAVTDSQHRRSNNSDRFIALME